jgi:hypothetical protein
MACRLSLGGPEAPDGAPSASNAQATQAARNWEAALEGSLLSGQLTLLVTEEQLTSSLAARLAQDQDPLLHNPAVFLRDGLIQIYGLVQQDLVEMTVRLAIAPVIDSQGRLGFEVTSADLGPLPAPASLRDGLSAMMSEALAGPMGSLATGFQITSVAIADGQLAIVAELR